jgi:sensor histidine kinase YesM
MFGVQQRYRLLSVFWVVLALNVFFSLIGIIFIYMSPEAADAAKMERMFSWNTLFSSIVGVGFSSLFYYFTINKYYQLLFDRKRTFDFIKPTLLAFLALAAYFALSHFLFVRGKVSVEFGDNTIEKKVSSGLMIFSYAFVSLFYFAISLLVAYFTTLRDEKKQRKILEEQKLQLEIEKSQANFNFLKAQINPHFLHNTLNFLYAKSLPYSPELSEGILTLADIMRYALSEGNARDGKAPLKDEIEHMRNVIKINQLRFSNNLNVHFDVEGVVNGHTIIPFVLITLVENAFKHGDVKSTEHPVDIKLKIEGNEIYFYCRNRKKTGPKELSTGIGLDNIKKRLDLAYKSNYRFDVKEDAEFYTTELTITQI